MARLFRFSEQKKGFKKGTRKESKDRGGQHALVAMDLSNLFLFTVAISVRPSAIRLGAPWLFCGGHAAFWRLALGARTGRRFMAEREPRPATSSHCATRRGFRKSAFYFQLLEHERGRCVPTLAPPPCVLSSLSRWLFSFFFSSSSGGQ